MKFVYHIFENLKADMKFSLYFRPDKFRSKDLWREARNKLLEALEDKTQTGEIKYEKRSKYAPLSFLALDMDPRLRLLFAITLQQLEDKARYTSIILFTCSIVYFLFF